MSASADFQKGTAAYNSGDYATALRIWKPLAKQGNAYAQYWLGWMYAMGEGVSYNNKTAVKWYRLAAKKRHALSQGKLSVIYALGKGVIKDLVYAHLWGNIAATNGNKLGAKVRYSVAKKMTPSQIEEAKNFSVNVSVRNTKGVEL